MRRTVHLDHQAVERVLESSGMRRAVEDAAEEIAENVRDLGIKVGDKDGGTSEYDLPVKVSVYDTDRARATVSLAHPAGIAVQAKHGALSRAAAAAGLEVRS